MNVEGTERIAFRFSRRELAALLKLMDAPQLPGISIMAEEPDDATLYSLEDSGITMVCEDRIYVDRTIAMVLLSAIRSSDGACAAGAAGEVALYRGSRMCVVVTAPSCGPVTVEPLPDIKAAREVCVASTRHLGEGLKLSIWRSGEGLRQRSDIEDFGIAIDELATK